MKPILNFVLLASLLFICFGVNAQASDLTFYSIDNTQFKITINGLLESNEPSDRVEIKNVSVGNKKIRIIAKNRPQINTILHIEKSNSNYIYQITYQDNLGTLHLTKCSAIEKNDLAVNELIVDTLVNNTMAQNGIDDSEKIGIDTTVIHVEQEDYTVVTLEQPILNSNCESLISSDELKQLLIKISQTSFEESKIEVAKKSVSNNCLNVNQLSQILNLFDFEDSKILFTKHIYQSINDRGNFNELYDSFSFEMSKLEIQKFVDKQ